VSKIDILFFLAAIAAAEFSCSAAVQEPTETKGLSKTKRKQANDLPKRELVKAELAAAIGVERGEEIGSGALDLGG
jgi:hypothetical protein